MSMSRAAAISAKVVTIAGAICVVIAAPAVAASGSVTPNGAPGQVVAPPAPSDGHPWDLVDGHPWDMTSGHPWD